MAAKKAKKAAKAEAPQHVGPRLVEPANGDSAAVQKKPRAGAYWHPMKDARKELGKDAAQDEVAARATELLKSKGGNYIYSVDNVAKFENPNKKPATATGKKRGRPRKFTEASDSGSYTVSQIQAVKKLLQDLGPEKAKALVNLLA